MYKACTSHLPSYLSSMVTRCSSVKGHCSLPPHFSWKVCCSCHTSCALNSKLTSSALTKDPNDCPVSLCTSELCKQGTVKLQLYCIVFEPPQRHLLPRDLEQVLRTQLLCATEACKSTSELNVRRVIVVLYYIVLKYTTIYGLLSVN